MKKVQAIVEEKIIGPESISFVQTAGPAKRLTRRRKTCALIRSKTAYRKSSNSHGLYVQENSCREMQYLYIPQRQLHRQQPYHVPRLR